MSFLLHEGSESSLGSGPSLRSSALSLIEQGRSVQGGAAIARDHISDLTRGRCDFSVDNPRQFRLFRSAQANLGQSKIQVLHWDGETECRTITARPPREGAVFYLALNGQFEVRHGARQATVHAGQALAISTPGTVVRHWRGRCDLLNLVVPQATLAQSLADNNRHADEIEFDTLIPTSFSAIPTAVAILQTIIADLASEAGALASPALAAQAERMMALLLLNGLPHRSRLTPSGGAPIAPFYIRRADRYLREHLTERVSINDLMAAAGVSERTLYYGFQSYRNTTPMRHLKTLRLDRARALILEWDDKPIRIGEIAARVGYISPSQFSRDYKERHGETPLRTLQTAQSARD